MGVVRSCIDYRHKTAWLRAWARTLLTREFDESYGTPLGFEALFEEGDLGALARPVETFDDNECSARFALRHFEDEGWRMGWWECGGKKCVCSLDAYAIDEDASTHSAPFGALVYSWLQPRETVIASLLATTTTTTTTTVTCLHSALRCLDPLIFASYTRILRLLASPPAVHARTTMSFNSRFPSEHHRRWHHGNGPRFPQAAVAKAEDAQPNELLSKRNLAGPPVIRTSVPIPRNCGRGYVYRQRCSRLP